MAEFRCDGLAVTIRQMEQLEQGTTEMIDAYLTAAAERMRALALEEAAKSPYRMDSLRGHVKTSKPKAEKDGSRSVTVTVSGTNERGERYGTIYFVLNYGRSEEHGEIRPSYFWTRAARAANDETEAIARRVMEQYTKGSE